MGDRPGVLTPYLRNKRIRAVKPHLTGRVLDFGCHVGVLAEHIDPDLYLGVDVDGDALEVARHHHPAHRFQLLDHLIVDDGFDTIVAMAVVEHLGDTDSFFRKTREWIAPNGRLVVTTPDGRFDSLYHLAGQLRMVGRHDEHDSYMDRRGFERAPGWRLAEYRRFLLGVNQLAVFRPA